MHGFKKENYHEKKKNKQTKKQLQRQTSKTKRNKPSFVSLVWLTNHIILQSMMTYQIERLPVKRGLSGLSELFRLQDIIFAAIVITSAKDARGELGMGSTPFSQITCVLFSLRPYPLRAWNRANLQRPTDTIKQAYLSWISQESLMANPIKPYTN